MAETMDAEHGGAHVQDSPASPPCSCCSYSSPPAAPPAPPTPSCSQPRPAKRRKTVHVTGNLEIIDPDGDSVLVVNRATFDGAAQLIDAKLAAIEAEDGAVGQAKREIAPVLYPGGESDQDTNMWYVRKTKAAPEMPGPSCSSGRYAVSRARANAVGERRVERDSRGHWNHEDKLTLLDIGASRS